MRIHARITGRCLEYTTSSGTILFSPELDRAWWKESEGLVPLDEEELSWFLRVFAT